MPAALLSCLRSGGSGEHAAVHGEDDTVDEAGVVAAEEEGGGGQLVLVDGGDQPRIGGNAVGLGVLGAAGLDAGLRPLRRDKGISIRLPPFISVVGDLSMKIKGKWEGDAIFGSLSLLGLELPFFGERMGEAVFPELKIQ